MERNITLSPEEIETITKDVEADFPFDHALQQVHIARKIISKEAQKRNQTFFEYINSSEKRLLKKYHSKTASI